ncbi:hypothetical protein McanMca71_006038 [Microsporum canis]
MPRSRYLRETPSPSSSRPLLQGGKDAAKSGRKSSLTTSFHQFAKNALQPLIRRQSDGEAGDGNPMFGTAPATRSSSLPVRTKGIFDPKQAAKSQSAGVNSSEPPLPPLPAYVSRGAVSCIPKPVTVTNPRWPLTGQTQMENLNPYQSEKKPFIGYQQLKALRGVQVHEGGDVKANEAAPFNYSPDSASDTSSQATIKATYKTSIPLPKSTSLYFPSLQNAAGPKPSCPPLYSLNGPKELPSYEGPNDGAIGMPKDIQRAIDESEKGSVEAFRDRRPNLVPPRQLPKSKTLGILHPKADILPEPPLYPIHKGAQCYCEDPNADSLTVDKYGRVSQRSASVEAPSPGDIVDIKVVKVAKPYGYWLGRLVTLMNSFRYEAAFNEPDPLTGYGIAGNTIEGKAPMSVNLDDYYIKRAFMVLERACLTSEASASLTEFKDAYSRRFGRKFSQRFATEIDKGYPKSEKTGGKGETGVMDIFRSVRKSFG